MGRVKSELAWDAIEEEKARKGNFYSEPLKDEVKRLRAELSAERALCAGLAEALEDLLSATLEVGYVHYEPLRRKARSALSELEKSK